MPGAPYTPNYKQLVETSGMNLVPSIVMALDKLDANKDAGKRKAVFEAAVAAITKWDAGWTDELKKVTDQKDKLARSQFAVEVRKLKQALQTDLATPPPENWWDKALAGQKCEPEKLINIPDNIADLQDDIEKYIAGQPFEKKLKPKCKMSKLDAPGKVLVLGNPEPATYPNGKPNKGWSAAEILNASVRGEPTLARSAADFVKDPIQAERVKKNFFYADDEVLKALFLEEEAHCYVDDANNPFDMSTRDAGRILVNAYAPAKFKTHSAGYAVVHEFFHAYEGGKEVDNQDDFGEALDEGFTEYFARDFVSKYPKWGKPSGLPAYNSFVSTVRDIIELCSQPEGKDADAAREKVFRLWFMRKEDWVKALTKEANKLSKDMEKKDPKRAGEDKTLCDPKLLKAFADALNKAVRLSSDAKPESKGSDANGESSAAATHLAFHNTANTLIPKKIKNRAIVSGGKVTKLMPLPSEGTTYDYLIFYGAKSDCSGGKPTELNGLKLKPVQDLIETFTEKKISFKNIILDSAMTVSFIPEFVPLLAKEGDGNIICYWGIAGGMIAESLDGSKKLGDAIVSYIDNVTTGGKELTSAKSIDAVFMPVAIYTQSDATLSRKKYADTKASFLALPTNDAKDFPDLADMDKYIKNKGVKAIKDIPDAALRKLIKESVTVDV